MTDNEKALIEKYRNDGISYSQIAGLTGISINSIKTYCRRHNIGGHSASVTAVESTDFHTCECCGQPVKQTAGRKLKRFCSDKCRMTWWNAHQDQVKRKAIYEFTCAYCGKQFVSYGNANRKYCSHSCYIEDRFGGSK